MTRTSPLHGKCVLISGAGVAGPALAHWLAHHGADVTVVEVAGAPRGGGFAVDFRGPAHLGVLERMGILEELRALQTHGQALRCVDARSREIFTLPAEFTGGEIEVLRRDLSRVLYDRSAPRAEYVFGDTVTDLAETADGVRVDFARSPSRTVDLVVGADGLHSRVRTLAFGDEKRFVRHLGYGLAGWDFPNGFSDGARGGTPDATRWTAASQQFNVPGRMASAAADPRDPGRAGAFLVFTTPPITHGWHDTAAHKALIKEAFAGLPWRVPELLATLDEAPELYFDSISRVSAERWTTGRIALLGDAAWGVTLGGMGVGTGLVGAYVLAGELAAAHGDHRVALPAYTSRLRRYAARWQKGASPGEFLAPSTATRLRVRNAMFRISAARRLLLAGTKSLASGIDLPSYGT